MIRLLGTSLQNTAIQLAMWYRQLQKKSVRMWATKNSVHTTQCTYQVTLQRIRATIAAMEKQ
jgi:hypothetical protein